MFPIIGSLIAPIFIGWFKPEMTRFFSYFIHYFAYIFPLFIIFRIIHDWQTKKISFLSCIFHYILPVPGGWVYGTDLNRSEFPWTTAILIIINSIIFLILPDYIVNKFTFLPHGSPAWYENIISIFTSAFLHGNYKHLIGNMIFLWVFGSTLEPRIGTKKFLWSYFICIITSRLIVIFMLMISPFTEFHSLGASGAISGIMGLFIVRCYFANIKIGIPFLFIPFVSISLKFQSVLLVGLFFAKDIAGSVKQFTGVTKIDYWAHVGGYVGGIMLGYFMGLHKKAANESVLVKANRLNNESFNKTKAVELYSDILKEEQDNETALVFFFRKYIEFDEIRAEPYYVRLMQLLLKNNYSKAIELFDEFFPRFIRSVPPDALFRFGIHFYKLGVMSKAKPCFEIASESQGPWQAKSMLYLAQTFEIIGNFEMAQKILSVTITKFPESDFEKEANKKLSALNAMHRQSIL
ncbi:MAG: rhomboid family intramembrane serine protease [Desulfobacterales bacterium]|nr:rhomboid family intramembrane serine protease [Desulfobacterales bacterium]